ncbi:hypothetical protein THAOC_37277 [Thalassiosira oceanica]|uniref:Uncharacterized protein n=1 Tax=Thalassiosira oceanica TaxID=159749 RepID=K0QYL9_THAOC|nr:hypothetical protein THAOC_37277 [Thalassiosira oceanica]|eukprot:EJK44208.1 hypothetical protein THAOC_37277 [Thalassiosira oceanica]
MDAPTSAPTSTPTVSMTPTLTPELNEPVLCQGSTPNFRDSHGDGCEWYEMADEPGCPHHGNHYEGAMGYMGSGYCTSADEIEDPFNQDPFVNNGLFGFDYTHAWEASTLEECKSACAAEHSNDPLFRGVTWMDPYACYCLKGWEGEEVRAGEITGVIDLFLDDVLCYAFTLEPTENQESATTETPGEAISGL